MTHAAPDRPQASAPAVQNKNIVVDADSVSTPARKPQSSSALTELAKGGAGAVTDPIGLAKVAGATLFRAMSGFAKSSIGAATDIAREVSAGEPITEIVDTRVEQARTVAWHALGLDDNSEHGFAERLNRGAKDNHDLRAQGNALIEKSWFPSKSMGEHPAFSQILRSLTPDEARILRFLAACGPQPAIDVRTKTPFGVGSERLAGGINMIADMAGCQWVERDQQYLANLNRLGMVRFSEEPVEDFRRYSLIEAQPKSSQAMAKAKKAMTVYRSIYLSLFGIQFCQECFDLEGYDAGGWADNDRGDVIHGKGTPAVKHKHH
ncbi:Abi-alpha family protein [Antrihabitans cavernicola]|uniref:DUF4393 domain-containing protein n=1 Tax=Antrihabitans cavernicola TaxID=2495913 RepID=A0A5A7S7M2_9NOCA|nr:Abi-alpha family protein [Spelaeibacter cavernicola]KAA0021142.1 DUF4393 domain-containing protein [Spelaeibacter cavernicola]